MLNRINTLVSRDPEASRRRFSHHMGRLNKAWNLAKASNAAAYRTISNSIKHFLATSIKKPQKTKRSQLLDSAIQQILMIQFDQKD